MPCRHAGISATNITTNKSITSKAMQYRQGIATPSAHYASGVHKYLNSNHTKYLAQLCGRFFWRFGKFPPTVCEFCGATYRLNYKMFNAL